MTLAGLKLIKLIQLKAVIFGNRRKFFRLIALADRSTMNCAGCHQRGLTLIELMIVIAIIGILSGIATPVYLAQIEKARAIKAVAELDILQLEIKNFQVDHDRLPESLEEVKSGRMTDPWGNAYRYLNFAAPEDEPEEKTKDDKDKKDKDKTDEGGVENSIRLDQHGAPLNSDYDLYSCGKDGKSAPSINDPLSRDDVVRGRDGAYIGPVSQFAP